MKDAENTEIARLVNESLDRAEKTWGEVGHELRLNFSNAETILNEKKAAIPTQFPGHDFIDEDKPMVDEFIALVLDMRDSSKHLNSVCADSNVNLLQRIYYETAALLPACSRVIRNNQGKVAEYLGDGLLAFFRVATENPSAACYSSHAAAKGCMAAVKNTVNPILKERYNLPPLSIGIGMAVSKAIVTLTGETDFLKPIAFGRCVFFATKLSKETNLIIVDETLRSMWPKKKGGSVRFEERIVRGQKGFVVSRADPVS